MIPLFDLTGMIYSLHSASPVSHSEDTGLEVAAILHGYQM